MQENVILQGDNLEPDYKDDILTQNARVCYPRENLSRYIASNKAKIPKNVILLCCDLYGVLPAVAKLNYNQAVYYFLSGYTAAVPSTEFDVNNNNEIKTTFSACFGEAFFARPAEIYAALLLKRLEQHQNKVYLVNTGWYGGSYGAGGQRFSIKTTRQIIHAIIADKIIATNHLAELNLNIPQTLENIDSKLLNPIETWQNKQQYIQQRNKLIQEFHANFSKFNVAHDIIISGPKKS